MYVLALSVTDVNAAMTKSLPSSLMLNVIGTVPTTGWKDAELVPAVYFVEPADGIWDFHLMAAGPHGLVNQVVTSISANLTVKLPRWCRGVRIIASTNKVEELLFSEKLKNEEAALDVESYAMNGLLDESEHRRDPGDAWPWLLSSNTVRSSQARLERLLAEFDTSTQNDLKVQELIGRKIRVVPKGGVITYDLHPNRVTFLLDEQGQIENWLPF